MINSGVWKPSASETEKKLAGSCEVIKLSLKSGGAAAVVAFYDGVDNTAVTDANLKWVLDASTTDVDNETFPEGLSFSKGVYAVCEQGAPANARVCIATNKYTV